MIFVLFLQAALAETTADADLDGDGKPEHIVATEGKVQVGKKISQECGYESLCEVEIHDIDSTNPQKELAICEFGPRDDRSCTLYTLGKKGLTPVPFAAQIYTEKYITNGNGIILTETWWNRLYHRTEKYTLQNGAYTVTPQPMYAAGATLHIDRTFPVVFAPEGSEVVANVRPDTDIVVLAEDGKHADWFLVKLSSGVTGWAKLEDLVAASDAFQAVMGAG